MRVLVEIRRPARWEKGKSEHTGCKVWESGGCSVCRLQNKGIMEVVEGAESRCTSGLQCACGDQRVQHGRAVVVVRASLATPLNNPAWPSSPSLPHEPACHTARCVNI